MNKKVSSESVVKDIRFMATDVVRKESIRKAKDTDKAKYSIRVDRKKPKEIALLIISNIAYNRLASGHGYVYRGVLSTIGKKNI